MAEKDQARALEVMAKSLASLAKGDLQGRITDDLPETFRRLQQDFNTALAQLESAMPVSPAALMRSVR